MAGGAIYYRASNLVRNRFHFSRVEFVKNRVHSTLSLVHEKPLNYPGVDGSEGSFLQTDRAESEANEADAADYILLDTRSDQPCHPGGGGAVCAVLSGMADRTPVEFEVSHSNFTRNRAVVGGAFVVATETGVSWKSRCTPDGSAARAALTTSPCRSSTLRDVRFERNRAEAAGGAIFATNLSDVFYSTEAREDAYPDFRPLSGGVVDERFTGNSVRESGYGADIAGKAVQLRIVLPFPDPRTGLLLRNQSSGSSSPLERIVVGVLDELGQVVRDGIVDSRFPIHADSSLPAKDTSSASGQVIVVPEGGIAEFKDLVLTARAGTYEVSFSVRRDGVEDATARVELRGCSLGEIFISYALTCERCPPAMFAFHHNSFACLPCPDHVRCYGGASLFPTNGYWHSSPFSLASHKCIREDACSYSSREIKLQETRSEHLIEFFDRFNAEEFPTYSNEEYEQCSPGYKGPVCGSCQNGYGQLNGKSCVECRSRMITATVVFVVGLWQLAFLAITIRSALVSIRDMNQMMAVQQQQTLTSVRSRRHEFPRGRRISGASRMSQAVSEHPSRIQMAAIGEAHLLQLTESNEAENSSAQQSPAQQHTVECIIAAQHVSEIIKVERATCSYNVLPGRLMVLDFCQLLPGDFCGGAHQRGMDRIDQETAGDYE